ncbi:hypothetical protein [Kitasatospora sp. NPDC050543]|uniref:hypothetical protein n=1 Tax=Kitasatospora sp. NPDC050543 TaxID=3364054 RepID=UPI0037ABAE24
MQVQDSCTDLSRPFQREPYKAGHVFGPYDNVAQAKAQQTVVERAGGYASIDVVYLEWGEWCE